jgi:hypothetical protein
MMSEFKLLDREVLGLTQVKTIPDVISWISAHMPHDELRVRYNAYALEVIQPKFGRLWANVEGTHPITIIDSITKGEDPQGTQYNIVRFQIEFEHTPEKIHIAFVIGDDLQIAGFFEPDGDLRDQLPSLH